MLYNGEMTAMLDQLKHNKWIHVTQRRNDSHVRPTKTQWLNTCYTMEKWQPC